MSSDTQPHLAGGWVFFYRGRSLGHEPNRQDPRFRWRRRRTRAGQTRECHRVGAIFLNTPIGIIDDSGAKLATVEMSVPGWVCVQKAKWYFLIGSPFDGSWLVFRKTRIVGPLILMLDGAIDWVEPSVRSVIVPEAEDPYGPTVSVTRVSGVIPGLLANRGPRLAPAPRLRAKT